MLSKGGFEPQMDSPEVELIYDMESRAVITLRKNHKYLYYYVRLSRGIPISSWYSKGRGVTGGRNTGEGHDPVLRTL
jgi:Predicted pseudouridylate synthase